MGLSKLLHMLGVANSDEGQMWPPAAPSSSRPKSALKAPPACDDKGCDDTTLASVVASFFNVDSPQSTVDSAPATRRVRFAPTACAQGVLSASSQAQGVLSASSQAHDKARHNVTTYHSADHNMARRIFKEKSPKINTRRTPSALAALSTGSQADAAKTEVMVEEVEDNASPLSRKHKKITCW
jgi:hypothetical protein